MTRLWGIPAIAIAILALAGCSSSSSAHAHQTALPVAKSTHTPASAAVPDCASEIGEPISAVLGPDKRPLCEVVPGSLDYLYGTTNCDPTDPSSTPIYFWTATDAQDPKHNAYNVYVIRDGGQLGTVESAGQLYAMYAGIPNLNYMEAARCPGSPAQVPLG